MAEDVDATTTLDALREITDRFGPKEVLCPQCHGGMELRESDLYRSTGGRMWYCAFCRFAIGEVTYWLHHEPSMANERIVEMAKESLQALRTIIIEGPCEKARRVIGGELTIQSLPDDGICAYCDLVWLTLEIAEASEAPVTT